VVAEAVPAIAEAAHVLFRQTPPGDRSTEKQPKMSPRKTKAEWSQDI